jgi:hypothetical protein
MRDRVRAAALLGAVLLLVAVDLAVARFDVFAPFVPATRPTSLFGSINTQLLDVVRSLYGPAAQRHGVVVLGNSQTEAVVRPLGKLQAALAAAGKQLPVVSLCVFSTAPTDAEVLTRRLAPLAPRLVVLGISPPDLGITLERARSMPVVALLDVGFADGLIPPASAEMRLDRWVKSGWHLYRYRRLVRDLIAPPSEARRTPAAWLDEEQALPVLLERAVGAPAAAELLALRAQYEASGRVEQLERYVAALRGPDYLAGVRARWRDLVVQPIQLDALRGMVAHTRDAGARPVWLLVPENPALVQDPEIGSIVRERSGAVASTIASLARELDVPLLDMRAALPASSFIDLNHVVYNRGDLSADLASRLAPLID